MAESEVGVHRRRDSDEPDIFIGEEVTIIGSRAYRRVAIGYLLETFSIDVTGISDVRPCILIEIPYEIGSPVSASDDPDLDVFHRRIALFAIISLFSVSPDRDDAFTEKVRLSPNDVFRKVLAQVESLGNIMSSFLVGIVERC